MGGDFPGGPVVKNLPSNEGDTGSIPVQGNKSPHAMMQLESLHAATTEPLRSRALELRQSARTPQQRSSAK